MKTKLLFLFFIFFNLFSLHAQINGNFAWFNKGLIFNLPIDCEVIADDSNYFEAHKKGFTIKLFAFENTDFNEQTQAEATQKIAKKVRYDKMEKVEFFYLDNFKCCAIVGAKSNIKVQVMSLLNQKSSLHFTAIIIYIPEMESEVRELMRSFWRRK
jgi:hypothetical protein